MWFPSECAVFMFCILCWMLQSTCIFAEIDHTANSSNTHKHIIDVYAELACVSMCTPNQNRISFGRARAYCFWRKAIRHIGNARARAHAHATYETGTEIESAESSRRSINQLTIVHARQAERRAPLRHTSKRMRATACAAAAAVVDVVGPCEKESDKHKNTLTQTHDSRQPHVRRAYASKRARGLQYATVRSSRSRRRHRRRRDE